MDRLKATTLPMLTIKLSPGQVKPFLRYVIAFEKYDTHWCLDHVKTSPEHLSTNQFYEQQFLRHEISAKRK